MSSQLNSQLVKFKIHNLRNEEHFQFNTEVRDFINPPEGPTSGVLGGKVTLAYTAFETALHTEDLALQQSRKSLLTDELKHLDHQRDQYYQAIKNIVKIYRDLPMESQQGYAREVGNVLHTYELPPGQHLSYNQETALLYNLLADLNKPVLVPALTNLNIKYLVQNLKTTNEQFSATYDARLAQQAAKQPYHLLDLRKNVDEKLQAIMDLIIANTLTATDPAAFEKFIVTYNTIATKYKNLLAQRRGIRLSKPDSPAEEPEPEA